MSLCRFFSANIADVANCVYLCTQIIKKSFIVKKQYFCFLVVLALAACQLRAQDDNNIFRHYSLSAGIGTTGVTADLGTMVSDYVGIRAGIDFMPKFKYSTKLSMSQVNQTHDVDVESIPAELKKVEVKGSLHNSTAHALMDIYPFRGHGFHLTVGAYFAKDEKIVTVDCDDQPLMKKLADFNARRGVYADIPLSYGQAAVKLGDYNIMPDENGNASAFIDVKKIRPYVGLGFGRAVPGESRFSCLFDMGVQLSGKPKVYNGVNNEQLTADGVKGEDGGILKAISKVSVYPVVSVRLIGRLF